MVFLNIITEELSGFMVTDTKFINFEGSILVGQPIGIKFDLGNKKQF